MTVTALTIIVAVIVFIILGGTSVTDDSGGDFSAIVGTVNGVPVNVNFFKMIRNNEIASTYQFFYNNYDVSDSITFWEDDYGGQNPLTYLNREAMQACAEIIVIQQFAQKYSILDDISYDTFYRDFQAENARREAAIQKNEPVFGPVQYGEYEYFRYLLSNTVITIKDALKNDSSFYTEAELEEYVDQKLANRQFPSSVEYEKEKANFLSSFIDGKYDETIQALFERADVDFDEDLANSIPARE